MKKLLQVDEKISERLHISPEKLILKKIAAFLAHTGDSWYLEIALFLIWVFSDGLVHRYSALLAGAIIIQASLVLAIKFLIKRRRPEGNWGSVYRNTDPHSFPSGHAARMIMLSAIIFGLGYSPMGWLILLWGFGVSFARIGLSLHYLSDVLGGWIIGYALAQIILLSQDFFYKAFPSIF